MNALPSLTNVTQMPPVPTQKVHLLALAKMDTLEMVENVWVCVSTYILKTLLDE